MQSAVCMGPEVAWRSIFLYCRYLNFRAKKTNPGIDVQLHGIAHENYVSYRLMEPVFQKKDDDGGWGCACCED